MNGDVITLPPIAAPRQLPHSGTLYTNLAHAYDEAVVQAVFAGKSIGQHAAWDFCGWVWFADGAWVETVMVCGDVVATYACADLSTLIDHVVGAHGSD